LNQIVTIVLPVFGLIGIGYVAAWLKLLPEGGDKALADFCFVVALPLLIFRILVNADLAGGSPVHLWLAYYAGFATVWLGGTLVVRRLFGRDARTGVVAGVSSAFPNVVLLAIPLVITAYGNEGATALAVLLTINLPVMMVVSAILNERALVIDGLSPNSDALGALRKAALALVQNPIIIGIAAGIVWRLLGLPLGGPAGTVVNRLADVAGTLALFTVGMNLRQYGLSGNVWPALMIAGLKLVIMPAIVFAMVATIIPLPPVWAKALVICAACPTGVNAWLVAARFRTGQALASNVLTLGTAASAVTVAVWLHVVEWL
jgi:malonate transporter and related proteins